MGLKKKIAAQSGARENQGTQPIPFSRPQPQPEPMQDPPVQEPPREVAPPLDTEDLARKLEARLAPKIEAAVSKVFEQQLYVELDRRFKSIQERMGEFDQIGQKEGLQSVLERMSKLEEMQRKLLERPPGMQTVRVCAGCGLAIPQGRQTCPDCAGAMDGPKPAEPFERRARPEPAKRMEREATNMPVRPQPEIKRSADDFPAENEYDIHGGSGEGHGPPHDRDDDDDPAAANGSKEGLRFDSLRSKKHEERFQDAQFRDDAGDVIKDSDDPADWDRGFEPPTRNRDAYYTGRNRNDEQDVRTRDYGYDPRPRPTAAQAPGYGGYQAKYQPGAPPPPQNQPAHPICPDCSQSLEFISAYSAWYCRPCRGYLDPSNGRLAKVDGSSSQASAQEQPIPVQEMPTKRYKDSEKTLGDFHTYIEIDPEKDGKQDGGQEENGKKKGFWPFKKK